MEFRLIYRGILPAQNSGNSRVKDKHAIRRQFHPQLRELWKQNQILSRYFFAGHHDHSRSGSDPTTGIEIMSRKFARCGYQFLPLIGTQFGTACSLDILFLRRDSPGSFIVSGGDIDNRIKTLFDALRVPAKLRRSRGWTTRQRTSVLLPNGKRSANNRCQGNDRPLARSAGH